MSNLKKLFIEYFNKNGHYIEKQIPLLLDKENSDLMFVNSGMCQFKEIITGNKESKNKQIANSQTCVRMGGKHNDYMDIGKDGYHLTMFSMLGNWSFGEYDKSTAIKYAYDFLVNKVGLNKDNIYVTYFEGKENDSLDEDTETKNLWKEYLPENKILKGSFKDNFWFMGSEGTCGPCTEIHYDIVGNRDASNLVNKDDPTVIEVWNVVFTSFNKKDGIYSKLDKLYVDTGMGYERLVMINDKKKTVFSTSQFIPYFKELKLISEYEYRDIYDKEDADYKKELSFRIIVDHFRTIIKLLQQGIEPNKTGSGYIIRKMIRRIAILTKINLGIDSFNLTNLIPSFYNLLNEEITKEKHDNVPLGKIYQIINNELGQFNCCLENATKFFKKKLKKIKSNEETTELAFNAKSTFGLPFEIIEVILNDKGFSLDYDKFEELNKLHIKVSKSN